MGQNLLLPYLEESTSINQLFEVPSGCQGFDSQPYFKPTLRFQGGIETSKASRLRYLYPEFVKISNCVAALGRWKAHHLSFYRPMYIHKFTDLSCNGQNIEMDIGLSENRVYSQL